MEGLLQGVGTVTRDDFFGMMASPVSLICMTFLRSLIVSA